MVDWWSEGGKDENEDSAALHFAFCGQGCMGAEARARVRIWGTDSNMPLRWMGWGPVLRIRYRGSAAG